MPKIGLVVAAQESSWISCKTIVKNIFRSYEIVLKDAATETFSLAEDTHSAWDTALKIFKWNPDELIFTDHLPHPAHLLKAMNLLYRTRPLPRLTFHIFGDFSIYPADWMAVAGILSQSRVRFICASPRQSALVSRFLKSGEPPPTCPFPVDRAKFHFDAKARTEWRSRLGIGERQTAIVYSGRISLQKNVSLLLSEFRDICSSPMMNLKLLIAGPFDAINAPLFGVELQRGYYYHRFMNEIETLPPQVRERVSYIGNLTPEELFGLHNAADVFCSFSLHHDEDFGMAPAEALMCGLPAVLTDWGGYASFVGDTSDVGLVPVRTSGNNFEISSDQIRRNILRMVDKDLDSRADRASRFNDRISISAAARILSSIRETKFKPFGGFNWKMQKHADGLAGPAPFQDGIGAGSFYREIYDAYLGHT